MHHSATLTRVLLVEDDEDDYILTRELLSEVQGQRFALDWAKNFQEGLKQMCLNQHDIVLLDYRLGAHNGVELLSTAVERGCQAPIILLTGSGQHQVDLEAMQAGASDYLVKTQLQPHSLERSIRYAIQRKRAAALAAFEQARLAAFGAQVGLILTRRDSLDAILQGCAQAMAQYLNASLAQIFTFDSRKRVFEPRSAAGISWDKKPAAPGLPKVKLEITPLSEGQPVLIKQVANDDRVFDQNWVRREGVVSYAAYPLMLEDKLVGLMSIFTSQPLSEQIHQEMSSVANGISLCIERKRSEEALDASEVRYRSVVENIKEVIFQMDEFGHWTFLNPAWTAVTGFEVKPTLGTFFVEYLHEEDREHNRHIFLRLIQRSLDYCRYETRFLTKNGKIRWVEIYAQLTHNADGSTMGVSGSLTDITERKMAESAIQKLAAFPRVNPNPVLEFASDGTLTYANDAAREMAQSLGKEDLLQVLPPNAGAIARECLVTGLKQLRKEVVLDGRTITWSFFPVVASHVVHCYGADVTDVLNLEAQFRHAQKLESVGQLAAGVAHDFNNILTVIQGYSECLLARNQSDKTSLTGLKQISDAAKRAAALTRQLLMFSRKQVIQPKILDLNAVLQNLANMLLRLLGEDIAFEADYVPSLPRIQADTGMLEQVVMNLAVNSRDAMPQGGKLFISTTSVTIDHIYAQQHPDSRPGDFVCLTVRDTGCGMDRKTLDRIFEPFFSTKEVGKGTGLGLATVYGIVKQHEGWVEVSSEVGVGTTFKIFFPAVECLKETSGEAPVSQEQVRGGRETILVVEDEPVLRELIREVLQQYDYQVIEARSGIDALRVWDEFDGRIDLLLTDMVMPEGMNGRELAAQLKKRKPELKVIYSSGYSPESTGKDFGHNDTVFLSKPYLPPQLARTVRQCLDDHRQRPARVPA
ncbi:MAG TPA: response regulator [Candidatus Limnocylindrales bacterium]|jgi:PAS domain S-box-containing protein|nr:response regulator [Candidatus Limnocylindrales bacterium]